MKRFTVMRRTLLAGVVSLAILGLNNPTTVVARSGGGSEGARPSSGRRVPADDLIVSLAQAPAWSNHRAALVRLYWAYFHRVPDLSGFDYWLTRLQAGTKTLAEVSSTYAGSSEFVNKYGNLSNADFVAQIYRNIYDREPDASGHVYWTAKLDRGEKTRGEVMLAFSEASEGIRHLQPHVDTVLIHLGTLRAMPARSVFDAWVEGIPAGVPLSGNVRNLRLSASYDALH